jgi:succinoglycan biosynthesis transport protein ExoP
LEIQEVLYVLKRRWRFIVSFMLLGVLIATAVSMVTPVRYQAEAKILLIAPTSGNANDLQQGNSFAQSAAITYANVASTPYVLNKVIHNLDLKLSVGALTNNVSAESVANTAIIDLTAKAPTPKMAADIANEISKEISRRVAAISPNAKGGSALDVRIIQPATRPTSLAEPRWALNLAIGALVGFVLAFVWLILGETLNSRIREQDLAAKPLSAKVLGIAMRRGGRLRAVSSKVDVSAGYRELRANVLRQEEPVVLLTAAEPSAGTTPTVVNLGHGLVRTGKKVVLVDANLNKPRLGKVFKLEAGKDGLTDALADPQAVSKFVRTTRINDLSVLDAGVIAPDADTPLNSPNMQALLDALRAEFDYVIIDAPPLNVAATASDLTSFAGFTVLVGKLQHTQRHIFEGALDILRTAGAKNLGVFLTHGSIDRSARAYGDRARRKG